MRKISAHTILKAVKEASIRANTELAEDVSAALKAAEAKEASPLGKKILSQLLMNAEIAKRENIPICQDTGTAVIFIEIGHDVSITDGDLSSSIEEGIRQGYTNGYLRKSMCHPFSRQNTGDNTPVIIHVDLIPGNKLKMWLLPKGGGGENMSRLFMLSPAAGWQGIKQKVVETVMDAGPNPCPPIIVGVGIGGNFEQSALLSKKALLRPLGTPNADPSLREMENELLEEINNTGIGPQGLGGYITALAVHILMMSCHIASLPLAINIQCHASRHMELTF
jgi:fumarate hydratase subunit alpha